jgi:hypothetical protein
MGKNALILLLVLFLTGCSLFQPSPALLSPWESSQSEPKRVVFLVFDSLDPRALYDPALPHLSKFKTHGLIFEEAWIGHLPTDPSFSSKVLLSGHFPNCRIFKDPKDFMSFMEINTDWDTVLVPWPSVTPQDAENQIAPVLAGLEKRGFLKDSLLVFVALRGLPPSSQKPEWLSSFVKKINHSELLAAASKARKLPEVSEVYYRAIASGKSYYIRTYRAPQLTYRELDWVKKTRPTLTQSLAHSNSPDILAFFSPTEEEKIQRIPLAIWSPDLKNLPSATALQLRQSRIKIAEIASLVLDLLKRPKEKKP